MTMNALKIENLVCAVNQCIQIPIQDPYRGKVRQAVWRELEQILKRHGRGTRLHTDPRHALVTLLETFCSSGITDNLNKVFLVLVISQDRIG